MQPTPRSLALALTALTLSALFAALPSPGHAGPGPAPVAGIPEVTLETVVTGLDQPLGLVSPQDGTGRLFLLEKPGTVRVLEDGQLQPEPWLDLGDRVSTASERGLLGLAFAPGFETTGRFYVSYTDLVGDSRLERYTLADPATGTPGTSAGELLLEVAQPFANHNGGHLAFGPDGHLYWSLGDGGSAGDPRGNGQDPHTLLGTLLRLDVSPSTGYTIPEDNPFADGAEGAPEVWAYGLRNPWRFSFDAATGDLWIGDVGQNTVEEIDLHLAGQPGGENYGWNQWEGHLPFRTTGANPVGKTFPVVEYLRQSPHCAVTGGYVYRGQAIDGLEGAYVYGDLCSGVVWAAVGAGPVRAPVELLDTDLFLASFGEDAQGELYLVDLGRGAVEKLVPA